MFGRATIRLGIGPHSSFHTFGEDEVISDNDFKRLLGAVICGIQRHWWITQE